MAAIPPISTASASSSEVFKQIEATANYYPPATYAQLLSFFDDYALSADPASGNFIPFTTTNTTWGQQSILFAIGLIPPPANVTGRLIDRTASTPMDGLIDPVGEEQVEQKAASGAAGTDPTPAKGRNAAAHVLARSTITKAFVTLYGREPTLAETQYAQAIAWLETNYGQSWKGAMIGSNNWGAVQCSARNQNASDCVQYQDFYPNGVAYSVSFKSYPTAEDGAQDLLKHVFTYRGTSKALDNGDVFQASYELRRGKYYGGFCPKASKQFGSNSVNASLSHPDATDATQACAEETITAHANTAKNAINDIAAANKDPWALGLGSYAAADAWWRDKEAAKQTAPAGGAVPADASGGQWQGKGSINAKAAQEEQAQLAGSPLLSSKTGKALTAAQEATIKATKAAIDAVAKCPPLAMMVNPASFSVKGEKIVSDGNWGRNGPIIEYWGDQQDKISASGKVAGFFAMDRQNAGGPGITRWARNFAKSWQNFQSLFQIYRNNGAVFLSDDTTQGAFKTLSMLGSIYIYYDTVLYIGSFDSFNITESDTAPHTIEYSFDFTVRASYLLDRTDDAFNYGVPQIKQGATIPIQSSPPVSQVITTQPVSLPPNFSAVNQQGQTLQQQVATSVQKAL